MVLTKSNNKTQIMLAICSTSNAGEYACREELPSLETLSGKLICDITWSSSSSSPNLPKYHSTFLSEDRSG